MINAADLPVVRARAEAAVLAENTPGADVAGAVAAPDAGQVPSYPSKKLTLDNGRYVVADHDK